MTSSGMKRGLAATAVSALAVTGLPFMATSAHADSLASQEAASNVTLHAPTGVASVKNDGVNTTVHLLANGGSNVIQVQFRYSTDAGATWTNIGSPVSRTNGAFSTEWAPPTAYYNLPVLVQAQALGNVGTEIDTDDNAVTPTSNAESIDIGNAPGSAIGVYLDDDGDQLGAVSGTTSDVAANPDLTFWSPSATGTPTTEDVAGTPSGGVRSYSAPVDFAGYTWDTDPAGGLVNEAIVMGEADGDDAEAVTLYQQTISSVTAVAVPTSPQSGGTSEVTVTVLDQNGKPVVGANVHQEDPDGVGSNTAQEKETNSQGQATFTVTDTNAAGGTTVNYFVDENNNDAYDATTEFRRSVTVTDYTPVATSITSDSHDGNAFDLDEYTADNGQGEGDLTVTVKDQNGAPLAGQTLSGRWTITPFNGGAVTNPAATITDGDADGVYNVALPAGGIEGTYKLDVWIEKDGTPGQTAGDLSGSALTFKAGQAEINWADDAEAQRQAGTTATFEAAMQLDDGTGLPGRNVVITWTPSGDAVLAAQSAQPGETDRTSNTTATSQTDGNGEFAVAISDPAANPNVNELNGTLDANGVQTDPIGNSGAPSTPPLDVDFLRYMTPANADDISISADKLFSYVTPGRPVDLDITVENADGIELTDLAVEVSVDKGFLSPNAEDRDELEADPAPAEGGLFGEWASVGTSEALETDDDGATGIVAAIEKDAGFDTSSEVTQTVTVKIGNVTKTIEVDFESFAPINAGEVILELDDVQTVTVLPNAPTRETVKYNVFTTDQFGNLVAGESVDISDAGSAGRINGFTGDDEVTSHLKDDAPAVTLSSATAGAQTLKAEWDSQTRKWTDADTTTAGFQDTPRYAGPGGAIKLEDVTRTDTDSGVNWYVIDYAASSYSLDSGDPTRTVGDTVHTTFHAEDQMGEPIDDLHVEFFRTGPDNLQDGDGNGNWFTNDNGDATYIWQGAKPGTAVVTSVVRDHDGDLIPSAELTEKTTFEAVSPARSEIEALLKLGNQADGDDVARVNAPAKAAGATVKLYKVRKDGSRVLLASKKANARGNAKFVVNDKNGRKYTKYQAKVTKTPTTFADWTPRKSVR